jgi:hypothetical protein
MSNLQTVFDNLLAEIHELESDNFMSDDSGIGDDLREILFDVMKDMGGDKPINMLMHVSMGGDFEELFNGTYGFECSSMDQFWDEVHFTLVRASFDYIESCEENDILPQRGFAHYTVSLPDFSDDKALKSTDLGTWWTHDKFPFDDETLEEYTELFVPSPIYNPEDL